MTTAFIPTNNFFSPRQVIIRRHATFPESAAQLTFGALAIPRGYTQNASVEAWKGEL